MAIVKYGPLASEVRGSIGGTTFTAGRFGRVCRARRSPVHRPTAQRHKWKSWFVTYSKHWVDSLSPAERADWENLADATTFTNSLGEEYHPTGINLYVRSNTLLRRCGQAREDTAPANAVGTHAEITYSWSAVNGIMAHIVDAPGVAHQVVFWLGLESPTPINYYTTPFTRDVIAATAGLVAGTPTIFLAAYVRADSYFFVRDRGVYATGEITTPFIQRVYCHV